MKDANLPYLLLRLSKGERLSATETENVFADIMSGKVDPVHLAAILTAMSVRGESAEELRGAVSAVRRHMLRLPDVPEGAIDVCGTGGDGHGTLNVSTATAFILAGLGVPVAKHGNRALSSKAGATDTLLALGIPPCDDLTIQATRLREDCLAFLSAPVHHPAMRHAGEVRRSLGFRTLFNLIGPLCNPAQVRHQMIGIFDARWLLPVIETLGLLGAQRVWAVHGETDRGGTDEITLSGPTQIAAWENGEIQSHSLSPDITGLPSYPISAIVGGDAAHNAQALRALLDGEKGAYRDTVLLNAAVALHVAGKSDILVNGRIAPNLLRQNINEAARAIDTGLAGAALEKARRPLTGTSAAEKTNSLTQQSGQP
ncbi:anthranilate phosphoribosyltransferase [Kozakia baliensis]|uniref:Anthranilate phosphoribosyltransferase n=1 Tax=Kozakia baliensis TaxID=153496 RepID=A0A1D8UT88_9PROT|nr:anthranilate phosphoribosyltransferase [Kozakia baliensis]AOX16863.1 anthranilate phosphoribosyltransferase [Kozakia baliensis]GBR24498.1 anthranilate phosphoribosyltransferase [Kozakia baliensis NRIC 0488]GEL64762.1 anthranilate phosphoribosyltransferase [Kozakia baliensis]